MKNFLSNLRDNLYRPDHNETTGEVIFYRIFEFFIGYFVIWHAWVWGVYIPNLGEVMLPLGIANYIDISFMFNHWMGIGNAVLMTAAVLVGFFGRGKYAYTIAIILFHFHYAARFSQGEISHGSNMVGAALFSFAMAHLFFDEADKRRKFTLGTLIFFIGLGYVTAAFSKMIGTGLTWVDGRHMWLWLGERSTDVLSQHGEFQFNILQEYMLQFRWLATIILTYGLIVEFLGWMFWYNKLRPYAATLLISMHIGILITMNINFPKYVYIMVLLGYKWHFIIDYFLEKYKGSRLTRFLEARFSPAHPDKVPIEETHPA
ncbi:MAG: hypothetical protein ACNA78_04690 [Balneolaceae bacterium]